MICTVPSVVEPRTAKTDGSGVKFVPPSATVPEQVAASRNVPIVLEWKMKLGLCSWKLSLWLMRSPVPVQFRVMFTLKVLPPDASSMTSIVVFNLAEASF